MPVLSVVIPRLKTNQLKWSFTGAFEARQLLIVRSLFPMLADPTHPAEATSATNESAFKVALEYGKSDGLIKSHDCIVMCQKVGDSLSSKSNLVMFKQYASQLLFWLSSGTIILLVLAKTY